MFERKASILVTGGAGYIGSHAVRALLDAGYGVVVIDDLSTGSRTAVDQRAVFFEGQVQNQSLVRAIMALHDVRAIMHFAGSIPGSDVPNDPLRFYRNNTSASQSLIDSAIASGVSHFIFSSTDAVYGDQQQVPIPESATPRPVGAYAMSKLMTEHMLVDVSQAHRMNHCTLRTCNVAGVAPAGRSGQSKAGAAHMIWTALEAVLGKRDQILINGGDFATPDGTGVRDYIHVSDLARAHVAALEALLANPSFSMTLNCGTGNGHSALEILSAVERVTQIRIDHRFEPRQQGDPAVLVLDNRAICETLHWLPKHTSLDEMIREAYRWEVRKMQIGLVEPGSELPAESRGTEVSAFFESAKAAMPPNETLLIKS